MGVTVIERSALVAHSPQEMFALVNDVAKYPDFLPWCIGAGVKTTAATEIEASLRVARGPLRSAFTTRNTLRPGEEIHMRLVDGPFKELTGLWRFEPIGDRGCRVSFRVDFEFKSRLTAAAFGAVFQQMCGTMVDAFVQRARAVYG
jgi:ribosome-associated toxin RatA of RatAB toxin-antitoxin module